MIMRNLLFMFLLSTTATLMTTSAYSTAATPRTAAPFGVTSSSSSRMSTTVAPPETDTDKRIQKREGSGDDEKESFSDEDIRKQGPLEYLEDDPNEMRDPQDPFHILLLGETYLKPKVSVPYVSGALQFVLEMPYEDAVDAAVFCQENGISCVGTWPREECLSLGKELQNRDLCVRVVPFVPGGQRGWQANKDADAGKDNSNDASRDSAGGDFIDADYYYTESEFD
mmetsp:Transcript_18904/g.31263  ORF Transcript_18904/g.31263 Transcript_18904/m.31263 type:complete len:226 (-) Transcript_18904:58-735(-)|eukprot:CAMPEP_0119014042 /NCGR_PEP_ID=MMETSP1176-20130426/9322_1 /TAXON_ID=265551 /ORGANISM="Synedropsis recta cf, Strain CCMP1620" /LENGTH=225 /DNA_ID=CAMNT_0006967177 /DNA_START=106 /DNA_END=783 /DNA_ORIENTATION=-